MTIGIISLRRIIIVVATAVVVGCLWLLFCYFKDGSFEPSQESDRQKAEAFSRIVVGWDTSRLLKTFGTPIRSSGDQPGMRMRYGKFDELWLYSIAPANFYEVALVIKGGKCVKSVVYFPNG